MVQRLSRAALHTLFTISELFPSQRRMLKLFVKEENDEFGIVISFEGSTIEELKALLASSFKTAPQNLVLWGEHRLGKQKILSVDDLSEGVALVVAQTEQPKQLSEQPAV